MQKTAYERRISDWSSDVCSSDLSPDHARDDPTTAGRGAGDSQCTDDSLANCTSCFRDSREWRLNHPHLAPSVVGRGTSDALRRSQDAVPVYGYPLVATVLYEHPQLVGSIGDQHSVVSGERVSVRVDIGGRCLM